MGQGFLSVGCCQRYAITHTFSGAGPTNPVARGPGHHRHVSGTSVDHDEDESALRSHGARAHRAGRGASGLRTRQGQLDAHGLREQEKAGKTPTIRQTAAPQRASGDPAPRSTASPETSERETADSLMNPVRFSLPQMLVWTSSRSLPAGNARRTTCVPRRAAFSSKAVGRSSRFPSRFH